MSFASQGTTSLLHLSDTHLGYKHRSTHDSGKTVPWESEINTHKRMKKAFEIAIGRDVDAVVHTGDVFDHLPMIEEKIHFDDWSIHLDRNEIPLYVLIGNHDYKTQGVIDDFEMWDNRDQITICSRQGNSIPNSHANVYGIHCNDVGLDGLQPGVPLGWDESKAQFQQPETNAPNILCLHERIAPPYSKRSADVDLEKLLTATDVDFDLVLAGHEHSPPWSGEIAGTPIRYASPTERISTHFENKRPFVNHIEITCDRTVDIERIYL
jgi:DNA repair exonuclease SbcCD nuclease subunit